MIQMQTDLNVADNSGARRVRCIKILGGSKKREASIGDSVVVAVQEAVPRSRIKKGSVHRAVVVRTVKAVRRKDGSWISFDKNAVILVNKQKDLIGTRVLGPVTRELRKHQYAKILSLAPEVL